MARIVLGVTGGIAAYKATAIIRGLTESGHEVKVIPTANALRFVGATTLEALSHQSVDSDLYTDVADVKHVMLGQEADLIIVAPATAAFLARYASGLADDLLLNTLLVTKAPVLVAPAMHTEMWQHASTKSNVALLRSRGISVLEPAVGRLTGADTGVGRLPEAEEIISAGLELLTNEHPEPGYLSSKKVLVTLGGTREAIDPVRFIGNASSGNMGLSFARSAKAAGAAVTVIAANVSIPSDLTDVEWIEADSAAEMHLQTTKNASSFDVVIMAAAVSDFRPSTVASTKIKKGSGAAALDIHLIENPDILREIANVPNRRQQIVGFAAETTQGDDAELVRLGKEKLLRKGCDYLVANDVSTEAKFGSETTSAFLLSAGTNPKKFVGTKGEVAEGILRAISALPS